MIELTDWIRTVSFTHKPWLVFGKGPSFSRRGEFDLSQYNLLSLNHVVREQKVDVAHIIDLDVVQHCGEALLHNCRWLLMPRRPHVQFAASQQFLLEDYVRESPVLRELDARGRLVWYNLSTGAPVGQSPSIGVRYFSSEAALNLLATMGVKTVRSLGLDGGRGYSPTFRDLEGKTQLAGGHSSYDAQFAEMGQIVQKHGLDYAPLIEPLRVFVGTDQASMMGTRLLEYSIRKHTSRPVEVVPMLDLPVPLPRDPANRPRTGFSFSRFLIPSLCGYRGRALYLDSDMQVFSDLAELWEIPFGKAKVLCTNQPEPPEAWKGNPAFHPGRQMSVMLLDCSRLRWDIHEIVRGLDDRKYTYQQLMFDLCLVQPDEIADTIPPAWNCLEHHEPGQTKLLHYTVVPMQPWKNDDNPLRELWMSDYREAVAAGAIAPVEVQHFLKAGHVKQSLGDYLAHAPQRASARPAEPVAPVLDLSPLARLQALELAERAKAMSREAAERERRQTWGWKMRRALTYPLRLCRRAFQQSMGRKAG